MSILIELAVSIFFGIVEFIVQCITSLVGMQYDKKNNLSTRSRVDPPIIPGTSSAIEEPSFAMTQYEANTPLKQPEPMDSKEGIELLRSGKIDEAIALYSGVLLHTPNDAISHQYLGVAYAFKGQMELAAGHLEAAVRLNPTNPRCRYNLGELYEKQGRISDAVTQLEAAVRMDPAYSQAKQALSRIHASSPQPPSKLSALPVNMIYPNRYQKQFQAIMVRLWIVMGVGIGVSAWLLAAILRTPDGGELPSSWLFLFFPLWFGVTAYNLRCPACQRLLSLRQFLSATSQSILSCPNCGASIGDEGAKIEVMDGIQSAMGPLSTACAVLSWPITWLYLPNVPKPPDIDKLSTKLMAAGFVFLASIAFMAFSGFRRKEWDKAAQLVLAVMIICLVQVMLAIWSMVLIPSTLSLIPAAWAVKRGFDTDDMSPVFQAGFTAVSALALTVIVAMRILSSSAQLPVATIAPRSYNRINGSSRADVYKPFDTAQIIDSYFQPTVYLRFKAE